MIYPDRTGTLSIRGGGLDGGFWRVSDGTADSGRCDAGARSAPGPRSALIIATSKYDDRSLARLRSPARDAAELAQVLGDPEVGGFDVTRLIDEQERETQRVIARFLRERQAGELVIVYLSCHGLLDTRGRLYFAGRDTDKSLLEASAMESRWLLDRLDECPAERQVLILDSCFSGAFGDGAKGEVDLEQRFAGPARGRAVLSASRAGEYSFEGARLGGAEVTSVFTAGLIDGLATGAADTDHDGRITIDDAYHHAAGYVRRNGNMQTPQRWLYAAEGTIVLARNKVGAIVTPAQLPGHISAGLDSPSPHIRAGTVDAPGRTAGQPRSRNGCGSQEQAARCR